jgi:hypothetical protein
MKLRGILLVLALAAPGLAWGQAYDQPDRIARLSYVEGDVTFQASDGRATRGLPDRPLAHGDRIDTERDSRAEIALGNSVIRLDSQSQLEIVDLEANATRIRLTHGSANVILDELLDDETFEILTPNTAISLEQPGEYRVDVFAAEDAALSVHGGSATVESAAGPIRIVAGQRVQLDGRDAFARLVTPPSPDAFDDWVLERETKLAEAEPPRYTPYEGERYDELDRYGDWYDDPYYGRVWMPGYGYAGWSPYHGGYWQRVGFGWSWFDPAPWGFFSYYGGRWTYLRDRDRWCWVPTRHRPRHHDIPESAPRTASWHPRQPRTVEPSPPAATPTLAPRRIDPDRGPTRANGNPTDGRPRGGTYAPSGNREPRPSPPVAAPPRDSGATTRPSSPPPSRAQPSSNASSRTSKDVGERREP